MITKLITKVKGRQISQIRVPQANGGDQFWSTITCVLAFTINRRKVLSNARGRFSSFDSNVSSLQLDWHRHSRPASIYPACQQENLGSLWRGASTSGCVNRVTIASHAETISLHTHETNSRYSRILLLEDSTRTMTRTRVNP